ncbi:hypothetical protein N7G274_000636 [Stereocaulon virgatum]|uniref:Uncharacterized protein n=1 Tax=Stereocaulon virgatum TaxID=373712 RepID=A0ABR4APB7_9LECA
MDSAPAKRLKTSPSTRVPVNGHEIQTRSISRNGDQSSSTRASFMSPTKASLARFNPSLLSQPNVTEPRRSRSQESDGERRGVSGDTVGNTHQKARDGLEEPRGPFGEHSSANGQGLRATPRRRSRTLRDEYTPNKNTYPVIVQNLRASPPDGAREGRNGIDATDTEGQAVYSPRPGFDTSFADTNSAPPASPSPNLPSAPTHLRLLRAGSGMSFDEDGEPSLPSTPVHLSLEAPQQPPERSFFSSPSRRPKRKGKAITKTLPLETPEAAPERSIPPPNRQMSNLGPRIYISTIPQPPPMSEEVEQFRMRDDLARLEKELQDIEDRLIRQTLVSRWQQEGSNATKELAKLRRDASLRGRKILRSREQMAQNMTARRINADSAGMDSAHGGTANGGSSAHSSKELSSTHLETRSVTQQLAHFLPFSNRHPPSTHKHLSPRDSDAFQLFDSQISLDRQDKLKISTANICLLPPAPDDVLLQRQDLVLSSSDKSLQVKLQVTVNLTTDKVEEVHVRDMSAWADLELGGWLRGFPPNNDLSAIGTAFGRYLAVAKDRAQCFHSSEQEFEALAISRQKLDEHPDFDSYLGQQALTFSHKEVALDIVWLCSVHDDGNIESKVSAKAKFPVTWQRTSGRAELDKVGEAFDQLVQDRGPLEAIRVIGNLIFSR